MAPQQDRDDYFRKNPFYDESSVSPFLVRQDAGGQIHRFESTLMDDLLSIKVTKTPSSDLPFLGTVEEIEDHYLANPFKTARQAAFDIFTLIQAVEFVGTIGRKGGGWIILMNPRQKIANPLNDWCKPSEVTRIGRWRLLARRVDRGMHVWGSDHLPEGVAYAVYRNARCDATADGLVIAPDGEGYRYFDPPQDGYVIKIEFRQQED